jgi:hypothetical protein
LNSNLIKRSKLLTMLISILKPKKNNDAYADRKDGIGFYVHTDPEDAESDKIKIFVSPYESGDLEEVLEFVDNFHNLTRLKDLEENGPALCQHARLLLREDALANFVSCHDEAMEAIDEGDETETQEMFTAVFEAWMTKEVPDELTGRMLKKSLTSKKPIDEGDETETQEMFTAVFEAWMTKEVPDELTGRMLKKSLTSKKLNKPYELTASEFVKRLKKINKYIMYCPGATAALTNEDLIAVLKQAVPQAWRVDLMKRNDYATMTLTQVESYFKLLENIKEPHRRRSGNDCRSVSSVPSARNGNGGTNRSGNGGNRGRGNGRGNHNHGTNQANNRGGNRRSNNPTNQAPAQQLHRSNRNRGPYCPHHHTNDHFGSTCPDHQQYIHTRTLVIRKQILLRNAESTALQGMIIPMKRL